MGAISYVWHVATQTEYLYMGARIFARCKNCMVQYEGLLYPTGEWWWRWGGWGLDIDKRRVNDHVYCSHSYVYLTTTALIDMHIASTSRAYVQLKPQWWERLVGPYTSLWDGRKREEGARGEEKAFHPKCRVDLLALASVNSRRNTRWLCYICKHGHRCTGI